METKVKTQSVTNTQIAVAVGVAILAGGLAFAASPRNRQKAPACTVESIEWVNSCPRAGQYHTARYVCSDGSTGQAAGNGCRTTSKLQQVVNRACSRKQCSADVVANRAADAVVAEVPAPVAPVAPVVDSPAPNPVADANQCGLQNIQYADSCGRNKYEKVEFTCTDGYFSSHNTNCSSMSDLQESAITACAYRDCRPAQAKAQAPEQDTNTDTTKTAPEAMGNRDSISQAYSPIVFISGNEISFRPDGEKISFGVRLSNRGSGVAGSDVKYTLNFLDGQSNIVQMLVLNLASELGIGDEKLFETALPIPDGALFVKVAVDPNFSDGKDNEVTSMIPTVLFAQ
jgi:hypothetical protein